MPTVIHVMEQRDDRGERHPPLEHQSQEDGDAGQEDDQSCDRLPGDLLTPGRADLLDADLTHGNAGLLYKRLAYLRRLVRRDRCRLDPNLLAARGELTSVTRTSSATIPPAALRASSTDMEFFGSWNAAPPLNSMPSVRPFVTNDTIAIRSTIPDRMNQRFCLPMKS
jgi:hypothetical protein